MPRKRHKPEELIVTLRLSGRATGSPASRIELSRFDRLICRVPGDLRAMTAREKRRSVVVTRGAFVRMPVRNLVPFVLRTTCGPGH